MNELKICKHSNGYGWCSVCGYYCMEGPCEKEELVEYVPVVRCKDCEYYKKSGEYEDETGEVKEYWCCDFHSLPENLVQMQPNDFCSYGKRTEGNNEN